MTEPVAPQEHKWRRRCLLLAAAWGLSSILLSFSMVRGIVAMPLYVHDADASGEAAYVMADGYAYWERLRAASDLYHMNRVKRIMILDERDNGGFNFVRRSSDTRVQRAIDYLVLHGVPAEKVTKIPAEVEPALGSLSESRAVARLEPDLGSLVVVTSAPHTRRSRLCFERSMPEDVEVQVYAASGPSESSEVDAPIWIEYVKLVIYYFVA
ncbi:hypothetical protein RMSM_06553 [Rhodopirellula maiorica SM1]|uniref:DUF218 domain-containing protein n=1 Tax=Rhodopirellula maiorica SM1 TaxID=1265738 RepID=M5RMC5_9BACT|nr:YdcF family protein [Rhodopirellula maiorica]EMI16542.1 hypothetical protein RMSM_06553 [Rhodopirellula maiorica SM1]